MTIQYLKDSAKYLDELTKYGATVYTECMDDMIKLMTEREVKAAIPILVEARAPFGALASLV